MAQFTNERHTGQSFDNSAAQQAAGFMQKVEMHNFCPKCGLKREAAWKFCPADGKSLTDSAQFSWQAQQGVIGGYVGTLSGSSDPKAVFNG